MMGAPNLPGSPRSPRKTHAGIPSTGGSPGHRTVAQSNRRAHARPAPFATSSNAGFTVRALFPDPMDPDGATGDWTDDLEDL